MVKYVIAMYKHNHKNVEGKKVWITQGFNVLIDYAKTLNPYFLSLSLQPIFVENDVNLKLKSIYKN